MKTMSAKDAKNAFGMLIDIARAEPVTVEKHGRPAKRPMHMPRISTGSTCTSTTALLLETHHQECARTMRNFIVDVQRENEGP